MMVGAALFWAATTLTHQGEPLNRISAEKVMLYQLVVSAPIMAVGGICFRRTHHADAVGAGASVRSPIRRSGWLASPSWSGSR